MILKIIVSICHISSGSMDLGQQDIEASISAVRELQYDIEKFTKTEKSRRSGLRFFRLF